MPETKNKSKKKIVGKKNEIGWLELVHKQEREKKKFAGSNPCSQICHPKEKSKL